MPAYMISLRKGPVKDPEAMREYQRRVRQLGGDIKVVARVVNGMIAGLEGTPPEGAVMVEFANMEEAQAWYDGDYQKVLPYRLKAADYDTFIVEGLG